MTSEQKDILEAILQALNIDLENFLLVGNMKEYDEAITKFEERLNRYELNLIQLNNRIAELEKEKQEKNQQDLLEALANE